MTTPIKVLNDGFVTLIDHMGSDESICNAARISYGNHKTREEKINEIRGEEMYQSGNGDTPDEMCIELYNDRQKESNRNLIRYLMRHRHTTPFEMASLIFCVRAPIHVARQWFRHRTWSYNEYSTRYKPAIDSFETTEPDAWRTQATDNKQGSGGFLTEWPNECTYEQEELDQDYDDECFEPMVIREVNGEVCYVESEEQTLGEYITESEGDFHNITKNHYTHLLRLGVAREQARKDLPLSTYTEFYAKVDLHNLFHFLSLRLDPHAQLEIRLYAEAIAKLVKPLFPASYQAFEDYRLNGCHFSAQEMKVLRGLLEIKDLVQHENHSEYRSLPDYYVKPDTMSAREWKEFIGKLK